VAGQLRTETLDCPKYQVDPRTWWECPPGTRPGRSTYRDVVLHRTCIRILE